MNGMYLHWESWGLKTAPGPPPSLSTGPVSLTDPTKPHLTSGKPYRFCLPLQPPKRSWMPPISPVDSGSPSTPPSVNHNYLPSVLHIIPAPCHSCRLDQPPHTVRITSVPHHSCGSYLPPLIAPGDPTFPQMSNR